MIIHFIWFGSIPHPEVVARIAAKMRYLKSMFMQTSDLTFFLWTTPDLMVVLQSRFTNEHLPPKGSLNLQMKSIDELFLKSALPHLSTDTIMKLRTLFIRESSGPISNKAVAADMIKFLALFHYGGLYVDAGLEIIPYSPNRSYLLPDDKNGQIFSLTEQKLFNPEQTLSNNSDSELFVLQNKGKKLLNKLHRYDYALTLISETSVDLQIMFFSEKKNSKLFLSEVINQVVGADGERLTYEEYNEMREMKVQYNILQIRGYSYTGVIYVDVYKKYRSIHRIYFFKTGSSYKFIDFSEIRLKSLSNNQMYENYRTKSYIPQDDTRSPSIIFPRKRHKKQ